MRGGGLSAERRAIAPVRVDRVVGATGAGVAWVADCRARRIAVALADWAPATNSMAARLAPDALTAGSGVDAAAAALTL